MFVSTTARLILLVAVAIACSVLPARAQLTAKLVVSGLTRPLSMVPYPGRPGTFLVGEQAGLVRVVVDGVLRAEPFLDVRDDIAAGGEQGLLGLALAPDFTRSGRLFLNFTNRAGHTVIARFLVSSANPLAADPTTRFDLVWPNDERVIRQPYSNHNGGHIAFGPDGYLYAGMGDGGSGNDPTHAAQNPLSLLGKMLRIDVDVALDHARGYVVPAGNPFVGRSDVLPEIWAFGLRNPWRWSFDDPRLGGTGAILIADVGQNAREEVNYEPEARGGRNYGWRNREGTRPNVTSQPPFFEPLRDPIHEYGRDSGQSITGGYVYRGTALGGDYRGRYVFGDFVSSRIWSIRLTIGANGEATAGDVVEHSAELGAAANRPASFALDHRGEILILGYGGTIHRIVGPGGPVDTPPPGGSRPHAGEPVGTARPR